MILDNVNEKIKTTFRGVARKGGSWSVRIAPFVNRLSKQPTILDKSVDRFEQNKRLYRRPSVIKKTNKQNSPFSIAALLGHCHMVTTLKRGEGVKI